MTRIEKKISLVEIKKILDDNPSVKNISYALFILAGLNVAGKIANGMASTVRGFKNFNSALNGE